MAVIVKTAFIFYYEVAHISWSCGLSGYAIMYYLHKEISWPLTPLTVN